MKNLLKSTFLSSTLIGAANANPYEVADLDPVSLVHYCPTDAEKNLTFGEVIATTNEFNDKFKGAVDVQPEELAAARKEKAQETLRLALKELSPDQIMLLGAKISTLAAIKPGENTEEDLKMADEILAELRAKQATLSTLVVNGSDGRMIVFEVDVTAKSLKRNDLQSAFGELSGRGLQCGPDVISYIVDKDSFPTLSDDGLNSREYDAYLKIIHPEPVKDAPVAPTKTAPKPTAEAKPVDENVEFMRKLQLLISEYDKLQKAAPQAIVLYTAYISR